MKKKISTTEWKVMEILWSKPNLLASDVVRELLYTKWSDRTIKTLLARLVEKGILSYEKEGRSYRYFPLISKNECIKKEKQDFINKIFNGSNREFITSFIKNERLNKEEIRELRELLNEKEADNE